jgi:hypothetical protein
MGFLQGKGIWTLKEDLEDAITIAPSVGAQYVLCEVSDQGEYDAKQASMSLRFMKTDASLTPVAWIYLELNRPAAEATCIRHALEDGFAAVILDVGHHTAQKTAKAEKLTERVLGMGLDLHRIYLCGEAFLSDGQKAYPYAELAKICRGGYMPRVYDQVASATRKRNPGKVIDKVFEQYELHKAELGYSDPPLPVLGGSWDGYGRDRMTESELEAWCQEVDARSPEFVSVFRAGTLHSYSWPAFEKLLRAPAMALTLAGAAEEILVQPDGAGYEVTTYPPNPPGSGWTQKFTDVEGHAVHVRNTTKNQAVAVSYYPGIPKAGRFTVEVFIPGTHATTRGANYFVVHHANGQRQEAHIVVNQYSYSDTWVPLGTYDMDPLMDETGRVNLVDVTNDATVKEIAFSAIRWRSVEAGPAPQPGGPGYDAPVGTVDERASMKVWPGSWFDATGYAVPYPDNPQIHTGADLNLNVPVYDSDKHAPVYAIGDGVVSFATNVVGSWGWLVVIRHSPLPDGKPVYSRYAHLEQVTVKVGDTVSRGQQIAVVGYFAPGKNYHLHFDISCTTKLEEQPRNWPGTDKAQVLIHYEDPRKFIAEHRPE